MICKNCGGTGKIGKVIPFTWLDCECRSKQTEHYARLSPADFDFPVSWDFNRFIRREYGEGDPGDNEMPKEVAPHTIDWNDVTANPDDLEKVNAKLTALRAMIQDVQKQNQRVKKKQQAWE